MKHRLRAAFFGICLATTLTGIAACSEANPVASGAADSALHMIRNGDHSLAFHVLPGRLPAIVLDAGGGADSSYWTKMAPVLAEKTGSMIVSYDRAGMGQSDEVPGPWKVENAVSDLEIALTNLGITHDVVLVSHSQAGEVATYFATENPTSLAGAVLVDASLPDFYTDDETAKIEAANTAAIAALEDQPSTRQTRQLQATAADYGPMHRAYHKVSWPPTVPAIAIVSADTPFEAPEDAQLWRDAQRQFVDAAPNRSLVTAERSSHDVAVDRPDVIVEAVGKMLKTVG